jgi:hypothetical protein
MGVGMTHIFVVKPLPAALANGSTRCPVSYKRAFDAYVEDNPSDNDQLRSNGPDAICFGLASTGGVKAPRAESRRDDHDLARDFRA